MSKSTKIVAGLGVAATLGVAALPVASFADTAGTHTVTVTASVAGNIVVKAVTGATTATPADITGGSSSGAIAFGNLGMGDQKVHDNVTIIDVETNYPNGYALNADAGELTTTSSSAKIGRASGASFTTGTGTFSGASSIWGIKVAKADWDYSANSGAGDWSATAGTLAAGSDYSTATYNAIANGTVDESGVIATNTRSKYTMNYGIGIANGQASGAYSGDIVYTVTATDYTAAPAP